MQQRPSGGRGGGGGLGESMDVLWPHRGRFFTVSSGLRVWSGVTAARVASRYGDTDQSAVRWGGIPPLPTPRNGQSVSHAVNQNVLDWVIYHWWNEARVPSGALICPARVQRPTSRPSLVNIPGTRQLEAIASSSAISCSPACDPPTPTPPSPPAAKVRATANTAEYLRPPTRPRPVHKHVHSAPPTRLQWQSNLGNAWQCRPQRRGTPGHREQGSMNMQPL